MKWCTMLEAAETRQKDHLKKTWWNCIEEDTKWRACPTWCTV